MRACPCTRAIEHTLDGEPYLLLEGQGIIRKTQTFFTNHTRSCISTRSLSPATNWEKEPIQRGLCVRLDVTRRILLVEHGARMTPVVRAGTSIHPEVPLAGDGSSWMCHVCFYTRLIQLCLPQTSVSWHSRITTIIQITPSDGRVL